MGVTLRRAAAGAYAAVSQAGFTHTALYWHFMGGVWLFLLAVLSTL